MSVSDNSDVFPDDMLGISGDDLCLRSELEQLRTENESLRQQLVAIASSHVDVLRRAEQRTDNSHRQSVATAATHNARATFPALLSTLSEACLTQLGALSAVLARVDQSNTPARELKRASFLRATIESCMLGAQAAGRVESLDGPVVEERFSLPERIQLALEPYRSRCMSAGIELTLAVEQNVPRVLIGDPIRFEQLVSSLLAAQVGVVSEGMKLACEVRLVSRTERKALLDVWVTSFGEQPFDVADGGFSCQLCEVIGGRLRVDSQPGYRRFEFRAEYRCHLAPESSALSNCDPIKVTRALRVLLVEDNAINQRTVAAILQQRGHAVEIAENGLEALSRIDGEHFDVVVTDIQLPGMDGFELTSQIRQRDAMRGSYTPVIASSISVMRNDRTLCINSGMDAYIAKPTQPSELVRLVEQVYLSRCGNHHNR